MRACRVWERGGEITSGTGPPSTIPRTASPMSRQICWGIRAPPATWNRLRAAAADCSAGEGSDSGSPATARHTAAVVDESPISRRTIFSTGSREEPNNHSGSLPMKLVIPLPKRRKMNRHPRMVAESGERNSNASRNRRSNCSATSIIAGSG